MSYDDEEKWMDKEDEYEERLGMIEEVADRKGLSEWEQGFIDSIHEQFTTKRWMSEKQYTILRRIYDK